MCQLAGIGQPISSVPQDFACIAIFSKLALFFLIILMINLRRRIDLKGFINKRTLLFMGSYVHEGVTCVTCYLSKYLLISESILFTLLRPIVLRAAIYKDTLFRTE